MYTWRLRLFNLFLHPTKKVLIPGLSAGGTRGDRWSPWGKNEKNKGGPGGTSLPLRVLRLPIWTFPDFLHFFVPSCPRTFKYRHKIRFQLPLLLSKIRQQREATANPVFASVAGKRPASETLFTRRRRRRVNLKAAFFSGAGV